MTPEELLAKTIEISWLNQGMRNDDWIAVMHKLTAIERFTGIYSEIDIYPDCSLFSEIEQQTSFLFQIALIHYYGCNCTFKHK